MTPPRPRRAAPVLAPLVAALVAWSPVAARADAAEQQARAHFRRGETHFAMGRFAEALTEYQAAFELKPLPGFLFNIGQCHRNLGHLEQAVFSFKKYLRLKPDARDRAAIEDLIADLERQSAAQRAVHARVPPPPPRPTVVVEVPPPRPPAPRPIYARWWFWTAAAAVVAGGVIGAYVATRPAAPPASGLGNIDFP